MSGEIRDKLLLLLLFLIVGVSLRGAFNHWKPGSKQKNLVRKGSPELLRKTQEVQLRFSELCWQIEKNSFENQKLTPEQGQFLKSTSTAYCFCMDDQVSRHHYFGTSVAAQGMKHNYLSFLQTTQGQKVREYCHQIAKYEIYRKTGRAIASTKPPTKMKPPGKQQKKSNEAQKGPKK